MKTVKEREAEATERIGAENARRQEQWEAWRTYLKKIEAMDIPPQSKGETVRGKARESIRADTVIGAFIDTACNHCGTALWDSEPHYTLASSPPMFWGVCIGCGCMYSLGLECRHYKDPHE